MHASPPTIDANPTAPVIAPYRLLRRRSAAVRAVGDVVGGKTLYVEVDGRQVPLPYTPEGMKTLEKGCDFISLKL